MGRQTRQIATFGTLTANSSLPVSTKNQAMGRKPRADESRLADEM